MKTSPRLINLWAVIFAAVLTITPASFAGGWAGIRRIDTGGSRNAQAIVNHDNMTGVRANRHGADDPANHDINDNRGGNQPGDNRGGNQPGDDRGRHHHGGR